VGGIQWFRRLLKPRLSERQPGRPHSTSILLIWDSYNYREVWAKNLTP